LHEVSRAYAVWSIKMAKINVNGFRVTAEDTILTIHSPGGFTRKLDATDCTPEIQTLAAVRGLREKLMDAAALGAGSSDDEKFNASEAVLEALASGVWSRKREKRAPDAITTERIDAVAAVKDRNLGAVRIWLERLTAAQREKVFATPEIVVEITRARAVRSGKSDTADVFEGL
jgi:hypothetical protein